MLLVRWRSVFIIGNYGLAVAGNQRDRGDSNLGHKIDLNGEHSSFQRNSTCSERHLKEIGPITSIAL